jgi:hypothetical protein
MYRLPKKWSPSLAIKGMQIKTTQRFNLTSGRKTRSRTPPPTNVGKDAGKKEPSYTAGRNVSYYNHFGKQYGGFLKN